MKEPCPASGRWLPLEPPCTIQCPECGVDTATTDRWSDGVKPASGVIVMDHSRELHTPEGAPSPDDRVWLLRFADERGDSVNDSASTRGDTLDEVRARQAAGYWPAGRPGAWSTTNPDLWLWADDVYPVGDDQGTVL